MEQLISKKEDIPSEIHDDEETEHIKRREEFKSREKNIIDQMRVIASARCELQEIIKTNPDISDDDLKTKFISRTERFNLSPRQIDLANKAIDKYVIMHKSVSEYREMFPDDRDLYQAVFGCLPEGRVEVKVGPMTLYFICYDAKDYARIYSGQTNPDEETVRTARLSGGVFKSGISIKDVSGVIIAENRFGVPPMYYSDKVYIHEEQHAIHRLFEKPMSVASYDTTVFKETDPEIKKMLILRYFRFIREGIGEHRVADEILSFKKDGQNNAIIINSLVKSEEEGGLYDFFKNEKKRLLDKFGEIPEIDSLINKVFVTEYQEMISKALSAFDELTGTLGLSKEEAIAFLTMISIRYWPKMVERRKKIANIDGESLTQKGFGQDEYGCIVEEFDRLAEKEKKKRMKY